MKGDIGREGEPKLERQKKGGTVKTCGRSLKLRKEGKTISSRTSRNAALPGPCLWTSEL